MSIWSRAELRVYYSWWFHSVTRVTGVELCQDRSWDPLQHLLGEDPEEEVVSSISLLQNTQSLTLATWATASRCQETQRQYGSHSCPETIMMFKRVEMGLDWGVIPVQWSSSRTCQGTRGRASRLGWEPPRRRPPSWPGRPCQWRSRRTTGWKRQSGPSWGRGEEIQNCVFEVKKFYLVMPSPMADFINRDSEGSTLMGG